MYVTETNRENIEQRIYLCAYIFADTRNTLGAEYVSDFQFRAVEKFGYSWEHVEAIEIQAYKDAEQGVFNAPPIREAA